MNIVLLHASDFFQSEQRTVRLTGRRLHHVLHVHRARTGDTLRVGIIGGNLGTGLITSIDSTELTMEVTLVDPPPSPLPLTLLLAIPRPKTLKKVLLCATSMGVKRIILIRTWRVEKSYFASPVLNEESLHQIFILGLEQGRDTILPRLEMRQLFRPFVEDEVPEIIKNTHAIAAHPGSSRPLPRAVESPVTLAVGPEGGFVDFELEILAQIGFDLCTLGPRPLRVEHALPALIGRLF